MNVPELNRTKAFRYALRLEAVQGAGEAIRLRAPLGVEAAMLQSSSEKVTQPEADLPQEEFFPTYPLLHVLAAD